MSDLLSSQKRGNVDEEIVLDRSQITALRIARAELQHYANEAGCQRFLDSLLVSASAQAHLSQGQSTVSANLSLEQLGLRPPRQSDSLGELGAYSLLRRIGTGGMAVVYEARDNRVDRHVAIKVQIVLEKNSASQERLDREARSLAKISHPHILQIFDVGETPTGIPYLVTEYASVGTLRDQIKGANLSYRVIAEIIASVADGLATAHQHGVIHRDIKPSNIVICLAKPSASSEVESDQLCESQNDVANWVPKLADFGLARLDDDPKGLTRSSVLAGTPFYMSPEQIQTPQSVTPATDVYSLGVTLYESMTGEVPFRGTTHGVLHQITHRDPPWPQQFRADIPKDLELICMKALAKEPRDRYASAHELAAELKNWLSGKPIIARPPTVWETTRRWLKENPKVVWLSATIMGLMLLITLGSIFASIAILNSKSDLEKQTQQAKRSQEEASQAAADAIEQRRITLETLNTLVGNVQTQLQKRPDTEKLREDLLKQAFEGLERVTKGAEDSATIDRATIDAHVKMSQIKSEQGDRVAAIDQARKSIVLAEKRLTESPQDIEKLRDLGNALTTEYEIHWTAFSYEPALQIAKRIEGLRQEICEAKPEDASAKRSLISIQQRIADIYWLRGELKTALEGYRFSLQSLEQLIGLDDKALDLRRDHAILLNRVALLSGETNQLEQAEAYYQKGISVLQSLLVEDPANVIYRSDLGSVLGKLAGLNTLLERHDKAVETANQSLAAFQELAAEQPNNSRSQTMIGTVYDVLGKAEAARDNFPAAFEAAVRSYEVHSTTAMMDPKTSRHPILAAEGAARASEHSRHVGDMERASRWSAKAVEAILMAKNAADYTEASVAPIEKFYRMFHRATQLMAEGESACRAQLSSEPKESRVALAFLAKEWARKGQVQKAIQLIREMSPEPSMSDTDQADVFSSLASTLAYCHARIDGEERKRLENEIILMVATCVKTTATLRRYYATEPVFSGLRKTQAFAALMQPIAPQGD